MDIVVLAALGVGGATVFGGILGFFVKRMPRAVSELTVSFAAGVMLAASVWGLIIPSLCGGGVRETAVTSAGIIVGALFVGAFRSLVPVLRFAVGEGFEDGSADGALMLVLAMAIHNFPEGLAVGVSLGSGDSSGAVSVAVGIALQNIPEGMAVIPPMMAVGIRRSRAFALALFTGFTEVAGTFLGYRAVSLFDSALPFALAFAGGAMIYVIAEEMLPSGRDGGRRSSYAFMLGICLMLLLDNFL